jgi:hypothetical protein
VAVELDHAFIACRPGAPEADALLRQGFVEGSPNTHPGQGTANRRFFFDNFMPRGRVPFHKQRIGPRTPWHKTPTIVARDARRASAEVRGLRALALISPPMVGRSSLTGDIINGTVEHGALNLAGWH